MKKIWKRPDKLVTAAAVLFVASLTFVLFFYAASSMGEIKTSEHFIMESDTLSIAGTPETSSSFNSEGSMGQAITGTGESVSHRFLAGFEETLNSTPEQPSSLSQYTADGTTIEVGGWIDSDTVIIKFYMYDGDASDLLTPQVELRPTTESFTGSPAYSGDEVSFGGSTVEGVVTITGLAPGTYHWRARIVDAGMLISPWISFGGNPETAKDLQVKGYGYISGTVTLSGEADNSGTLVEAFDSGIVYGSAETASDGTYMFRVIEGTYSVEATMPGFDVRDFPSGVTVSAGTTVEGIDLAIPVAWPMFKQDRWHTGNSPDKIMNTPLTMRWSYVTGGLVYSNPVEVNGKVFIGGGDENVYALDARAGSLVWSYYAGGYIDNSVAVANGMVFAGTDTPASKFFAFYENTGQLKWSRGILAIASPTVAHNRVYVGSGTNGTMYALDQYTGAIEWQHDTGAIAIMSTPAVCDGKVFFGTLDKGLQALDEASGSVIWSYPTGDIDYSSPAVHNGRVFICSINKKIYCLDENDGGLIWSYQTNNDVLYSSPSVSGGKVFVGAKEAMYALDEASGALVWSYPANAQVGSATVTNGNLFFGCAVSGNVEMLVLDADTGSFRWSYATNSYVRGEPTIYSNRLYYSELGSGMINGAIYSFENDVSPESPSSLAQYRYDGVTVIPTGEWTNKGKVIFKMTMDDLNDLDTLYPEIELRPTSESFAGVPTATGEGILRSGEAVTGIATVSGISTGLYHWRARVRDSSGWTSGWIAFGGNAESQPDFKMDTIIPAVTVTKPVANSVLIGGSTTEISWIVTKEGGSGLLSNPISIFYTTDEGVSWNTVVTGWPNTGSLTIPVPDVSWPAVRVSVEAEDNAGNVGMGVSGKFGVLRPGWISGTVTLSGEADNSGTLVEAFISGEVYGSAETASDGSYMILVLEGTYSVEATKSGFEVRDYPSGVTVSPVSTLEGINIVLTGAWPMYKQDRWHTGNSPDTIMSTPLTMRWSYATGGLVYSNPVEVNGKLFVGSYDTNVYGLDARTGSMIWSYTTAGGPAVHYIDGSTSVANGMVFIGNEAGWFYALDEDTGQVKWADNLPVYIVGSSTAAHNRVYVPAGNSMFALDQYTGSVKWSYLTSGVVYSTPAVVDGMLIFGGWDAKVYALDELSGSLIWSYDVGALGSITYSSPAVHDGRIFIGDENKNLYCLDENTGSLDWSYHADALIVASPSFSGGKVFIGSEGGIMYAVDEASGALDWSYDTNSSISGAATVSNGDLFFGTANGKMIALDEDTGSFKWSCKVNGAIFSEPTTYSNRLYFSSFDHNVYCFENDVSPESPSSLAQYRYDGVTLIPSGNWTNKGKVIFKMTMDDLNDLDTLYPEIELRPTSESFAGVPTATGEGVLRSGEAVTGITTVSGISSGLYHWQARVRDSSGWNSGWIAYGGNTETQPDFMMDVTPPGVTVTMPVANSTVFGGETTEVSWIVTEEGSGLITDPITLYYSNNNGATWELIASNEANDGSFTWNVPLADLSSCRISVEAEDAMGNIGRASSGRFEIFSDGWVKGTVTLYGESNHSGVKVEAFLNNSLSAATTTISDGSYVLRLFSGTYEVEVNKGGYQQKIRTAVITSNATAENLDYTLKSAWPQTRQERWRTANSPDTNLFPPFSLVWSYSAGFVIPYDVKAEEGRLYLCADTSLTVLSEAGKFLWKYNPSGGWDICWGAAVQDDRVYAKYTWSAGTTNYYVCLSAESGGLLWSADESPSSLSGCEPLLYGGLVYFVRTTGRALCAYDMYDGTFKWSYVPEGLPASPYYASADNGTVYFGTRDKSSGVPDCKLYAVDSGTGTLKWSYQAGTTYLDAVNSHAVSGDRVYLGKTDASGNSGKIIALNASDGSVIWSYVSLADFGGITPANGKIYFQGWIDSYISKIYCIDQNGGFLWSRSLVGAGRSQPTYANGVVYCGTYSTTGEVWAFDADSGNILWSYGAGRFESGVTVYNRKLYIPKYNGQLYVFETDVYPPSPPPTLDANALPSSSPSYVGLTWSPAQDNKGGSGIKGYNIYRSGTHGSGYTKWNTALLTGTSTTDPSVSHWNSYYYVATSVDLANNESAYSNEDSPPNLGVSKTMTIEAPTSGGYSGRISDAVPGSTITFRMVYTNNGFAPGSSIVVVDKIPPHTEYKLGSATGEGISSVLFSNNNGATYTYVPAGTLVDGAVTNIKWNLANITAGASSEASFKVIIQ